MTADTMIRELLLDEAERAELDLPEVGVIRRRARRRRWRTGSALAVAAVLIVAVGSIAVRSGDDEIPTSVFVSEEVGKDGQPAERVIPVVPTDADAPPLGLIVPDGGGGFVGVWQFSDPAEVRRSADGVTWQTVGRWDIGGRRVDQLLHRDGLTVAVLGPVRGIQGPDRDSISPRDLQVALSRDFDQWEVLSFELTSGAIEGGQVDIQGFVAGLAHAGETTLLEVVVDVYSTAPQRCGSGRDERGVISLRCNGEVDVLVPASDLERLGIDEQARTFVRHGDGPFRPIDMPPAAAFRAVGDRIVANDVFGDRVWVLDSDDEWVPLAELDDQRRWFPIGGEQDVALFLGGDQDVATRIAAIDLATGEVTERALPLNAEAGPLIGGVVRGPFGWAMVVSVTPFTPWGVLQEEWAVLQYDRGAGSSPYAVQRVGDRLVRYTVEHRANPAVDRGLFGELRIRKLGADDVLIDLDAAEARAAGHRPLPERSIVADAVVEVDGWTVSGDLIDGPLMIEEPDGRVRVLRDGHAFTNGDVGDGVELDTNNLWFYDDLLTVYDADGEPQVEIRMRDLLNELTVVDESAPNPAAEPGDAWILTSPDGLTWSIAWEGEGADFGEHPQLVGGDDEVLVLPFGTANDPPIRIPLEPLE